MARARAHALHILLKTEKEASLLLQQLQKGGDFAKLAKRHSTCPSGKKGGDLGEFYKGQMVKPFEQAVFKAKLFEVVGPVKTQFGFHLIKVIDRTDR